MGNQTSPMEFILSDISEIPSIQIPLSIIFLTVYIIALMGNWVLIVIIYIHPFLQTPMYFFISNLGCLDIFYISTTVPKMLVNSLTRWKTISFGGCVTQLYFYLVMAATESTLLSTMAFDRYMAICNPLRYSAIMNNKLCLQLALSSWLTGFCYSAIHTATTFRLDFCRSNVINHFFCDILPLLTISCTDININMIVVYVVGGLLVSVCFPLIIISYINIIKTILKIPSALGRRKTFSTCVSHLSSVYLFYFSGSFAYFRPPSSNSLYHNKINAVFYTILPPMLNPLIYSLRNKELKRAIKSIFHR